MEGVNDVIQSTARTDETNFDSRIVNRVLVRLLDDLTDASPATDTGTTYRAGYSEGTRVARICVLDEIAFQSGSFVTGPPSYGYRRDRQQVRTRAALQTIVARLSRAVPPGDGDDAAGYREAISAALQKISQLERNE